MREIKVPRVATSAFDKNRRASDLLRRQVAQLEHVVAFTRGAGAVTLSAKRVRTEGQAAKFIAEATRALNILARPPQPPNTPGPTPAGAAAAIPAPATRTPERARGGGSRTRPIPARSEKKRAVKTGTSKKATKPKKRMAVAKGRRTR